MKLAIVGSTVLDGNPYADFAIRWIIALMQPTVVVSGGAKGVDTMAENIAKEMKIPVQIFRPTQKRWHGPGGYKERNTKIAQACDGLVRIASQDTKTYGSGWTRDLAMKLGKPVSEIIIHTEDQNESNDSRPLPE